MRPSARVARSGARAVARISTPPRAVRHAAHLTPIAAARRTPNASRRTSAPYPSRLTSPPYAPRLTESLNLTVRHGQEKVRR